MADAAAGGYFCPACWQALPPRVRLGLAEWYEVGQLAGDVQARAEFELAVAHACRLLAAMPAWDSGPG